MEWIVCCTTLAFATILLSPVEGNLPRPTLQPNVTGHLIPKGLDRNQTLEPNATGHLIPKGLARNDDCLTSGEFIQIIPVDLTVCVESPNFPGKYPHNSDSIWMLDNEDQSGTLIVSCHPFKVKRSKGCKKDYLGIGYPGFFKRYCGKNKPDSFEVPSYWVDLTFKSDRKKKSKGFRCYVTAVAGNGTASTTTLPGLTPSPGPTPSTGTPNPDCECGLANMNRIVGGVPASPNEYPWLVGISTNGNSNWPWCGGSVYNSEWIITAAHCVNDETSSNIKVVLGMYNWDTNSPTPTERDVSQIIVNEHYNPNTIDNDIALIRMSSPVTFSYFIRPVCLPSSVNYAGQMATVTGWGTLTSGGSQPDMNYEVQVRIRTHQECIDSYGPSEITDNMICAGTDTFNKDSCQGDSGGPLTVPDVNGHHHLVGIVSWGYGCAQSPYYGVYTNVPNYNGWIRENAGPPICTP